MPRNPDNPRTKPHSAKDMRELAARLEAAAAAFRAISEAMDDQKKKEIRVDGRGMVDRAFVSLGNFAGNCEKELRDF